MLGFVSDVGNVRTLNEDYYGYLQDKDYSIYAIADGMGGHNAGEVASKIAVEETINVFKKTRSITEAIRKANEKIYLLSVEDKKLSGMGTTITVAVIENNNIEIDNSREKIHIIIGLIDNLCHEVVYHKHDNLNYDLMKKEVVSLCVSIFKKKV